MSTRLEFEASIAGVKIEMANQSLNVVLTPSNQDMLPGFSLGLLAAVEVVEEDGPLPSGRGTDTGADGEGEEDE